MQRFAAININEPGVSCSGPNTKIVGKVIDAEMKRPLPSANIELLHAEDSSLIMGTISKTNGTYQFENFPFGQYFIRLSYMYFQQKTAKCD